MNQLSAEKRVEDAGARTGGPAANDLDSIITRALAERDNEAAAAADAESSTAVQATDAAAPDSADAASSGDLSPAAEPAGRRCEAESIR
jgi:hypothetical protein